jgi:chemotaxis protein methyltransferase CheR
MHADDTLSSRATANAGLARLADLVASRMGLHFPENRQQDLLRAVRELAREQGGKDTEEYLQALVASPLTDRQVEILTANLTVGETYFFREMKSLDAFRDHVIPERLGHRAGVDQRLRIWSAGCSTGEEAYSIAMILSDVVPNLSAWDIYILATDINTRALEKARRGVYTEWSFRGMPAVLRERFFTPLDPKTFTVKTRFSDKVSFAGLNLATDTYPSLLNETNAMDVIFCRNVLMYLVPEQIQKIIKAFQHCLVEGGWLIVAPSETCLLHGTELESVSFEGATLFRKTTLARQPPAVVPAAPPPPGTTRADVAQVARAPVVQRSESPFENAMAAYHAGRYEAAAATLQRFFDAGTPAGYGPSDSGNAFALMARIEANQGKLDRALEWSHRALTVDKTNPGFYYLLATILEEQNRPVEAVQELTRALFLDSSFILAHYALGTIALREQGRKAADRHFRHAAALLARLPGNDILPESEGMTAGRLLDIIRSMTVEQEEASP